MPTTYNISTGNEHYQIRESGGIVTEASRVFDWAIGCQFGFARDYFQRKGWKVLPVTEHTPGLTTFNYKGSQYCLFSNGRNITRITKDDEDISWSDLPDVLKGLL